MKCCSRCGESKQLSEFYKNRANSDGLQRRCKQCHVAANRDSRDRHPETERRRRQNPARRAYMREVARQWKAANPEKHKAQRKFRKAVAMGRIIRAEECSSCGVRDIRIDGHHPDYSKPLEVVWMCTRCHNRLHAALRSQTP